jgi:hypothetical protein
MDGQAGKFEMKFPLVQGVKHYCFYIMENVRHMFFPYKNTLKHMCFDCLLVKFVKRHIHTIPNESQLT